jgi:hypothetical protein
VLSVIDNRHGRDLAQKVDYGIFDRYTTAQCQNEKLPPPIVLAIIESLKHCPMAPSLMTAFCGAQLEQDGGQ